MRRGQDRFQVGEQVRELLFPDASPLLRGIALGTPLADVRQREGESRREGTAHLFSFELEDPHDNGRLIELRVHEQETRTKILGARFYSRDKMDIDAAYREVKSHLDKTFGRPERELGGALTFVWRVPGEVPGTARVSRYKDSEDQAVLDVSVRPDTL